MAELAKADWPQLEELWRQSGYRPEYSVLRGPETGLVMVQGRMGGSGAPFNVGEMTVTRCAVDLTESGHVGHSYVKGRNRKHAETAAILDGLLQDENIRPKLEQQVVSPLRRIRQLRRQSDAAKSAATKVDFFTMVRGEDD